MELVHIKDPDDKIISRIVEIEEEAFDGKGNVDLWIIKALIRYGLVFVVKENDEIVSIVEYMQQFNEKKVFLYGISTLKKYRCKGYANFLLEKTENYLRILGYEEIELTVDPNNEVALKLYDKHKYINEKLLKDEYGKNINRYVMRKKL